MPCEDTGEDGDVDSFELWAGTVDVTKVLGSVAEVPKLTGNGVATGLLEEVSRTDEPVNDAATPSGVTAGAAEGITSAEVAEETTEVT